jgi:FMN phosphatase YigB (HAD superfamily)
MNEKKLKPANIIFDLNGVIFGHDQENYLALLKQNPKKAIFILQPGLDILTKCAEQKDNNGNKLHTIYVLSNWGKDGFEVMKKIYPQIMSMFDGHVISGESDYKKPNRKIYLEIINKYNLQNERCIFIDDVEENIVTAEQFEWIGLHYNNPTHIKKILENLKVLPT